MLRLSGDYRRSALKLLMDFVSWKHSSLHYLTIIYNTVQDIILKLLPCWMKCYFTIYKTQITELFSIPSLNFCCFATFGICCISIKNTILGYTAVPKDIGTLHCSSYQNYVDNLKGNFSQIVMLKKIYKFVNIKITHLLKRFY